LQEQLLSAHNTRSPGGSYGMCINNTVLLLYSLPESQFQTCKYCATTASATASESECRVPASGSSAVESNVSSALQSRVILILLWFSPGAGAGEQEQVGG